MEKVYTANLQKWDNKMIYRVFDVFDGKHKFIFADERVAVDAYSDTAISNKILEILEEHKHQLQLDPKIIYSGLFDKLNVHNNVASCMYMGMDNQLIWERYLHPECMKAECKVFAKISDLSSKGYHVVIA